MTLTALGVAAAYPFLDLRTMSAGRLALVCVVFAAIYFLFILALDALQRRDRRTA